MPSGIILPYYFLFLRDEAGLDARQISYLTGISGLTIILFQQFWGYMGDVVVPKKYLIVFNSLVSSFCFFLISRQHSFWIIAVLAFAQQAASTPLQQLFHGYLFMHEGSERHFGRLRAWGSLGFIAANTGIAFVADRITGGKLGFIFPFFVIVTMSFCLLFLPMPDRRTEHAVRPTFLQVQGFFLGRPQVALFLAVVFFYQAAHGLSYTFQSFLMREMGADMRVVSLSYSLAAFLELPVFFALNRLIGRWGETRLILFAAFVQALRWLLIWGAATPGQIIAISALHCITFGLFYAAAVSYMNRQAGVALKASAQAIFALVYFGFAAVVGNVAGGQVTSGGVLADAMTWFVTQVLHMPDRGGLRNLYIFCSALALISAGLCMLLIKREGRDCRQEQRSHIRRPKASGIRSNLSLLFFNGR